MSAGRQNEGLGEGGGHRLGLGPGSGAGKTGRRKCLRRSDYTLAEMIFKEIWVAVLEGFGQFDIGDLILLFEV